MHAVYQTGDCIPIILSGGVPFVKIFGFWVIVDLGYLQGYPIVGRHHSSNLYGFQGSTGQTC